MNLSHLQKYVFSITLFCFYILAWLVQTQLLLKGDVCWQMHLARVVLTGGHYVKDFFEINPPLSIYLYTPAVMLQQIFALKTIVALRIYIFLLATLSLTLCYFLVKRIFLKDDEIVAALFLFTLFFVYLILPLNEFGQRECLIVYFTMPYFLLVSLRLDHKELSRAYAIGIGLLAGIGFAIKPFYLMTLVLVEAYIFLSLNKNLRMRFSWLRPETFSIILFIVTYLIGIEAFHPEYNHVVIAIATRFYYQCFRQPWQIMLMHPLILFIVLAPIFYLIPLANNPYKKLCHILIIVLCGFFLAYLVQQISWFYHLLPALSIALLLYSLLYSLFLTKGQQHPRHLLFSWLLGAMIFAYPFIFLMQYYLYGDLQYEVTKPLISELRASEKGRPIYFFSSKAAYMVSILEHAGAIHASRLQFLAWMNHYYAVNPSIPLSAQQRRDELFFVDLLAEDINNNKPDLIYVDQSRYPTLYGRDASLDYLKILSQYSHFKAAWLPYHYVKTIEHKNEYKFAIYRRDMLSQRTQ